MSAFFFNPIIAKHFSATEEIKKHITIKNLKTQEICKMPMIYHRDNYGFYHKDISMTHSIEISQWSNTPNCSKEPVMTTDMK